MFVKCKFEKPLVFFAKCENLSFFKLFICSRYIDDFGPFYEKKNIVKPLNIVKEILTIQLLSFKRKVEHKD